MLCPPASNTPRPQVAVSFASHYPALAPRPLKQAGSVGHIQIPNRGDSLDPVDASCSLLVSGEPSKAVMVMVILPATVIKQSQFAAPG